MNEKLVELILGCLREMGEIEGRDDLLHANHKSKLFGPSGLLDSMGLVGLIVEVEQSVSSLFGKHIVLANEKAMSRTASPFRNVESLANYSRELIEEAG